MGNEASQPSDLELGECLKNDMIVAWKRTECENPFPGRDGHCSCSPANSGKMFVFGGVVPINDGEHRESNELLVFDTVKEKWERIAAVGEVPPPRCSATMAAVGSKLYVFGGLSNNIGWLSDMHVFDTETNVWKEIDDATGVGPTPRDKLASAVMGDKIYMFGGFGPKSANDNEDADSSSSDDDGTAAEIRRQQDAAKFGWFDDLFVFNAATSEWSRPMHMNGGVPTPRAAHTMCALSNYLVIFGGRDSEERRNDLHVYDTAARKWINDLTITGRQPEPRSFHSMCVVGSRVVIIGGRGLQDRHHDDIHVLDTASRHWLQPAIEGSRPSARGLHSLVVVNDLVVLFGGSSDFNRETMQCTRYYNDVYSFKTADIRRGGVVVE